MPKPLIVILLFVLSCSSLSETEKRRQTISGNWLIISPDHNLQDAGQYRAYSHIQDSIVGLMGLKMIKLSDDGTFQQLDSAGKTGRWGMTPNNIIFVEQGGRGFEDFSAGFADYKNGLMHLTQFVEADGERIELTWNLKKITGNYASKLFAREKNEWRNKPSHPETEQQMRQRLSDMLHYYSAYYKLVTREANFFISKRVILPFTFYQHAMAMKPYDEASFFSGLFFNKEESEKAWNYLKRVLVLLRDDYPHKTDFLEEYSVSWRNGGEVVDV
jgi:hypothetical protein